MRRAEKTGPRWTVCAALVASVALTAGPSSSETVVLKRQPLPLVEGLELDFKTVEQRPRRDTYTARISILTVDKGLRKEPERVRFRWRIFERQRMPGQDETGLISTTGLLNSQTFNPYWTNGQDASTTHTHAWLSRKTCEALVREGTAEVALDVSQRGDEPIILKREGVESFELLIDGRSASMSVLRLKSQKNDELLIAADCDHPLVVQAKIQGSFERTLTEARTGRARRVGR